MREGIITSAGQGTSDTERSTVRGGSRPPESLIGPADLPAGRRVRPAGSPAAVLVSHSQRGIAPQTPRHLPSPADVAREKARAALLHVPVGIHFARKGETRSWIFCRCHAFLCVNNPSCYLGHEELATKFQRHAHPPARLRRDEHGRLESPMP